CFVQDASRIATSIQHRSGRIGSPRIPATVSKTMGERSYHTGRDRSRYIFHIIPYYTMVASGCSRPTVALGGWTSARQGRSLPQVLLLPALVVVLLHGDVQQIP